jgi:mycothiol maleylpyruvate isomerase-like protein
MAVDARGLEVKTDEVLDALAHERSRLLSAVDALGPRAETAFVTEEDGWTAKDVLAHLIHYAGQIAFGLGAQLEPPAYVVAETKQLTGQEWNERAVAFWRDTPLADVRAEFERNVDLLVERVRLRSDEDMLVTDAIPWPGQDRPLWQFIGYDTFLHEWPAHSAQIEGAAAGAST